MTLDPNFNLNIQKEDHEEVWDLPSNFDLYSKAELRTIYYPQHEHVPLLDSMQYLKIECLEPNTPLDICNTQLSSREFDGTGHCVWSGAFLLIQCIDQILNLMKYVMKKQHLYHLSMIELGCGTGIGGLSILKQINSMKNDDQRKIHCCFTDADPAVLQICERNCQWNQIQKEDYSIHELQWGTLSTKVIDSLPSPSFHVVLATDVLYDIDLVHPLFTTAAQLLSNHHSSIFILSHIPRACYNDNNPPEAIENLELYIIDQAKIYGFQIWTNDDDHDSVTKNGLIRPSQTKPSFELLEFCSQNAFDGAVIFIFQKMSIG